MRGGTSRRRGGATTVSIPIQATATGSVATNAFTGWTNLAGGSIANVTAYGTTTKNLHANSDSTIFARSTGISLDQEVTFWTADGRVYLRLTDAGAALCCVMGNTGSWQVFYVPSVASDTYFDTGYMIGSGTPSGINMSSTASDVWVFGCSGFEFYVKWNGVEQWRAKQIFHHVPGRAALRARTAGSGNGFRSFSVEHKLVAPIFSSPVESIIDVRDMGLKTLTATGSMSAASTTLTLTSNPGFAVGDPIIVVIGGETGAGERGTRGVGGQWPTLTYANNAAMTADASQSTGRIAARLDNGLTYRWSGSAWDAYNAANFGGPTNWHDKMLPRSLETTITNVSGTTLTLADASTVATTGATVVYNNATRLEAEIGFNYAGAGIPNYVDGKTINWPVGTWYFGQYNSNIVMVGGADSWTIRGAGRDATVIRDVPGVTGLRVQPENKTNLRISGIEFRANRKGDKGYFWFYESNDTPQNYMPGILNVQNCTDAVVNSIRVVNIDFGFATNTGSLMDDIEASWEVGQRNYSGWQVNLSNCTNCTATNIVIDNERSVPAVEIFGGVGNSFHIASLTNGIVATNTADDWEMTIDTLLMEENCANHPDYDHTTDNVAVIGIATSIDPGNPSFPGVLRFGSITVNYANDANYLWRAINISGNNQDIDIIGDYPAKPATQGLITFPTGWSSSSAKGIYSGGDPDIDNINITGIRVTPPNSGSGGEVFLYSANSSITNSVVDVIDSDQTESGNITNAAYEALP